MPFKKIGNKKHVGGITLYIEKLVSIFRKHGRSEGAKPFAVFYFQIEFLLHLRITGISQDGTVSEAAGTPLHSPLVPSDTPTLHQMIGHNINYFFKIFYPAKYRLESAGHKFRVAIAEFRTGIGSMHLIVMVIACLTLSPEMLIIHRKRRTKRPPGITRCRLYPDAFKDPFFQQLPIGDTVERRPARQAKTLRTGQFFCLGCHFKYNIVVQLLHYIREIAVMLLDMAFGGSGLETEKFLPSLVIDHPKTGSVLEIILIHPYRTVGLDIEYMGENLFTILFNSWRIRISIGRHAHQFVFTRVDLESQKVCECGIKQTERMGKPHFDERPDDIPFTLHDGRGRPFTDAVDCQNGRFTEGRWVKRACGVTDVMFGKEQGQPGDVE